MNPTLAIWDEAYAKGRGGGTTHDLLEHYEDGDTIVVHNSAMAHYVLNMAQGRIPKGAVFVLGNLADTFRLRGRTRVLIDHAALDWLGRSRKQKNAEWMELMEIARQDRRRAKQDGALEKERK